MVDERTQPKEVTKELVIKISRNLILLSIIPLTLIGCGVQGGRFVTSGDQYAPLAGVAGCVHIIDGYNPKLEREQSGTNHHLLYVLFVSPCLLANGSGASSDSGRYVTTISHKWNITNGTIAGSFQWDRRKDTVLIGKQEFRRDKGNLFIVRIQPGNALTSQQLGTLGSNVDFDGVLEYVRQQLPDDPLIKSLKFAR